MSSQTLLTLTQLLKEANESVDLWKERCRNLEWNCDVLCKRVRELEKKFYCTSSVTQHQTVKILNNRETFELCIDCTERIGRS